jgi:3-hydroxybutyryl-CoA dehydrogenase
VPREFATVGVVGLGTMGAGIVEVFARNGLDVVAVEISPEFLERGRATLTRSVDRAVARGKLTAADQDALLGRVSFAVGLGALDAVDLVVEAAPERLELKRQIFGELDRVCKPDAVLASNTSSLSVTEIAVATQRPGQVIGMHFFNPAPIMKLVEVVRTVVTADDVVADVAALCARLGKVGVGITDRAGFIANYLLFGYLNHAVAMLESRYATREDIDAAMKLGAGLPMGPLTLLDLIGLDTAVEILDTVYHRAGHDRRHAPAPLLRQMVTAGLLGRKSGRGFYAYDTPPLEAPPAAAATESRATVAVLGGAPPAALADAGAHVVPAAPDVVGLHFVGDRLVEVVRPVLADDAAVAATTALVRHLGRHPVVSPDRAGYIVEALLYPYLNDAVRLVESAYASVDDIDHAMKLGCGYPAGPFEMLDTVGLDVVRAGLGALYAETREPGLAPAPLLEHLVVAGRGFRS